MTTFNTEQVLDALKVVMDPDQGKDLVSTNSIQNVQIDGMVVSLTVNLSTTSDKVKQQVQQACESAIRELVHKDIVPVIKIGTKPASGNQHSNSNQNELLPQVKNIIAVASGKGGVGKSTVAANLAVALAKTGASVGLVDTDIYGPSVPTMFGLQGERPNINTQRKLIPLEKFGVKLLSMGFLVDTDEAVVWRGPMVSSAVKQFLTEAIWGPLDYLVMDLPPGTGDIQLTIVQTVPLSGAVIVSTPQDVALDDARKGVTMFRKVNVPVLGIIENMAYFIPPDAPDKKYYIFGKDGARNLASRLEVPFLGEVPLQQPIREGGDFGKPVSVDEPENGVFTTIAEKVALEVANRNNNLAPTEKIEIKFK